MRVFKRELTRAVQNNEGDCDSEIPKAFQFSFKGKGPSLLGDGGAHREVPANVQAGFYVTCLVVWPWSHSALQSHDTAPLSAR